MTKIYISCVLLTSTICSGLAREGLSATPVDEFNRIEISDEVDKHVIASFFSSAFRSRGFPMEVYLIHTDKNGAETYEQIY